MNSKYINLLVFMIIILCLIYLEYKYCRYSESFTGDENEVILKIMIKKTLNYKKIYSNDVFTVWEPEPIDDYFPINQAITKNNMSPTTPAILVKSDKNMNDRPEDYTIVASTEDSMPIWEPISKNNYVCGGHIFSKNKPSKHRFRCINKYLSVLTNIQNNIVYKDLKKGNNKGYTIWNIRDTNNFIASSLNNSSIPTNMVYVLNKSFFSVEREIKIKKTRLFDKIWSYYNIKNKTNVSIWRPRELGDYYPVGYITIPTNINPNNNLESILVHKDFVKSPIDYGENSIASFKMKNVEDEKKKNNIVSFWRPICPTGYTCLSDIAVDKNEEPESDTLIYCIPIEYTKNTNNIKEIWNSVPNLNNKLSIWNNNSNFLIVNNDYSKPLTNIYELNYDFVKNQEDLLDLTRSVILKYEKNKKNTEMYNDEKKHELVRSELSKRLGINKSRLKNIKFNDENKTINISIISRPAESDELSTYDIKTQLTQLIKNNGLRINNSKNDNYIFTITDIDTIEPTDKKHIALDNRNFKSLFS